MYPGQLGLRVFPLNCLKELSGVNMEKASWLRAGPLTLGRVARPWGTWPAECPGTPPLHSNIWGIPPPCTFFSRWPDRRRAASFQEAWGLPHAMWAPGKPSRDELSVLHPSPDSCHVGLSLRLTLSLRKGSVTKGIWKPVALGTKSQSLSLSPTLTLLCSLGDTPR